MNILTITGRIGQDPVLRYTPSQKAVLNVNVATDVGFGDNKKTQWVTLTLWEKRAEGLAPHLAKGDMISASGEATARAWINKQSGEPQCIIEMNAQKVTLCGGGGGQSGGQSGGYQAAPASNPAPGSAKAPGSAPAGDFNDFDDDIPF
jgi:single-strand DNA-binding protein